MVKYVAAVLTILLGVISVDAVQGYDVIDFTNGATVRGTVVFEGEVPADGKIVISENADYCGKEQREGKYIISDSKVKNVVVWIEGIDKGKALPEKQVNITIKDCRAVPHVDVGFVGGEYIFRNDDDILHTVQSKLGLAYQEKVSARPLEDGASIYNLALPRKGHEVRKPIKKWHRYTDETGFIQIRSNTHNWIRGYVFIFDHPYAAVTDEKGSFSIESVPPGEYVLKAWHEGFGVKESKIKVGSGTTREVDFAFSH